MTIKEKFLGQWNLISMTSENEDEILYPIGRNVKGLLSYSENNIMSAQLGSLSREKFLNPDYRKGTDIEIINSFNNYISYFGKYKINEDREFIIHQVEQSLFPNWIGTKVKRYYHFFENKLTLKVTPISYNGKLMTPTLLWEKI
jgi:hypothetical protein